MEVAAKNEKEILSHFLKHEGLQKLRAAMHSELGNPVWWFFSKIDGECYRINEPGSDAKAFHSAARISTALKKHADKGSPFTFEEPADLCHFCIPLHVASRLVGYFVLSGIRKKMRPEPLDLLAGYVALLLESSVKTEEINALSATLRPRAIALSTVHTVHRIINSTLNLDELVSRLGHLTAQVLRVQKCVIYLVAKPAPGARSRKSGGEWLVCKARVGFPKKEREPERIAFGQGIEGRVARSAEMLLRKKFMCIPLIDEDLMGVVLVKEKKDKKPFNHFDLEILTTLAEEAVIAIKNAQLYEDQRRATLGTIQSLAVILGSKTPSAHHFPQEVFLKFADTVARDMRLTEEESQALHYAVLLKDTTKVGIPDEILKKSEKLTADESKLLREHPIHGARIVGHFENLKSVTPIILYSREKFDGTGYPKGLKGEKIPVGARIFSVLNAFEAIVSGRPYRNRASIDDALAELSRNRGTQFDPHVVDAFVKALSDRRLRNLVKGAR